MIKIKTSRQTRANTYSKSKVVKGGDLAADHLFDRAIGSPNSKKDRCALQEFRGLDEEKLENSRKSRTKEIQSKNGKLLSNNNAKENFSNNESAAFLSFQENLKKKKEKESQAFQEVSKPKRKYTKKGKTKEKGEKPLEVNVELFAEDVDGKAPKLLKNKRKKNTLTKAVPAPFHMESRLSNERKDLNASIEIARDKIDSLACPIPPQLSSPELFIVEPERGKKLSLGDSVLDGDNSFSTDYEEVSPPICPQEESSKYTYTYVSTYTQGTSCPSSAKSIDSLYVPMKKNSYLNSTTCHEKINITELEFPISPIPEVETTPMKNSSSSNRGISRQGKNKYSNRKKQAVFQPPKCSTMLFASEMSGDLEFPVSGISAQSIEPPAALHEKVKATAGIKNCSPAESSDRQRLNTDKDYIDDNQIQAKKSVVDKKAGMTGEKNKQQPANEKSPTSRSQKLLAEKGLIDSRCDQDEIVTTSNKFMERGISALKNLKRKASICISSTGSEKSKTSRRVTFSNAAEEIQSPYKRSSPPIEIEMGKSTNRFHSVSDGKGLPDCYEISEERLDAIDRWLSRSSKPQVAPSIDLDDQVVIDVRRHLDENGQCDLKICCVSRLCLRYRSHLMKNRKENSCQ